MVRSRRGSGFALPSCSKEQAMSPLRQKMIREAQLRQFSPSTIKAYVWAVKCLSGGVGVSP